MAAVRRFSFPRYITTIKMEAKLIDLSSGDETLAREFISEFDRLVRSRSIWKVRDLHFLPFPENDGQRYDEWGASHHMSLCENALKSVISWSAKAFEDPGTRYFETHEFTPVPTIWIEALLKDEDGGQHHAKFACAPGKHGKLKACNWVLRSVPKQRVPRTLTPNELKVAAFVEFHEDDSYERRVIRYCESNDIVVPPVFGRKEVSRYAVIDLASTPPKLVALTFDATEPLVAYLDRTEISWKQDENPPMRILDFETGRQLHHLGGWELFEGASFVLREDGEPDDARESPS